MHSSASFIAIFSVWLAGIAFIIYLFLPSVISSRNVARSYDTSLKDSSLRQQMDIGDKSLISFSPLALFDIYNK